MRTKICKLIITFSFVITAFLVFCCNAFALFDPISGAMAGSAIASGFPISGFAGMPPDAVSTILNPGISDPYDWGVLDRYTSVHIGDNNRAEVTLSPDIAKAGERRLENVNQAFGLSPGTTHLIGNYPAIGSYVFYNKLSSNMFTGGSVGNIDRDASTQSFYVGAWASLDMEKNSITNFRTQAHVGQNSSSQSNYTISQGATDTVHLRINNYSLTPPSNFYFNFITFSSTNSVVAISNNVTVSSSGFSFTNYPCSIGRNNNSSIVDPLGKANKITLPSSYLDNISYTPDTTITDNSTIEELLAAILKALTEGDIEESVYVDPEPTPPGPTPVPTDTVSETLWTTFTTWFDNYFSGWTESFGDIYDGIIEFQESFGDWVEDVASGWTEVFGDIYDTLSGWTEVFGDIYDGIIDGFGDIADILEGIYDYVADIVQEIVNADANWVNGFINNFLSQFQDWFDVLKQHVSIWHYVVEWLASIGSVFSFFFGVMSNTGYNFVLPIYACFAGTVVIAIYRRFGK